MYLWFFVFVGFCGEWKENEKEYVGGQMKESNADVSIKVKDFGEIYRISGIISNQVRFGFKMLV